ncbi:LAFA_0D07228g1_1 [Lachancea sp. 'fantastica']|nr:LAFA_0D07228g1_1 [Lachancea sp. 'fantastica']
MDLLDDTWDLPVTKNINRDLFSSYEDGESFDVDSFLLDNNFHYVPLDTLCEDLTSLTREMDHALLDASSESYKDFIKLCDQFSDTVDTRPELQNVKLELTQFLNKLRGLTETDILNTQEIIKDTVDYLETLDKLSAVIADATGLNTGLQLAEKLSNVLNSLCANTSQKSLEYTLCGQVLTQLHQLTTKAYTTLENLQQNDSPLMLQLRSEYHSIIAQFRACLHVLCDKCVANPNETKELAGQLSNLLSKERQA